MGEGQGYEVGAREVDEERVGIGRRALRPLAIFVIALGLSPLLAFPALAEDRGEAADAAPVAPADLLPGVDAAVPFTEGTGGKIEAVSEHASTTIDEATVTSSDRETGTRISITPSEATPLEWRIDDSGAALASGAATDYVVQPDAGGVAVVGVLGPDSPRTLQFDIDVSPGLTLNLVAEDGSIDIVDGGGLVVGVIDVPWAVDAKGQRIPTRYTLQDRRLTQHIEVPKSAVFPIVADPHVDWGIITGTVYFNKPETKDISDLSGVTAACAFFAPIPVAGVWLAAACATEWATWVALAVLARNHNKCLKLKFGFGIPTPDPVVYSGKHCTTK